MIRSLVMGLTVSCVALLGASKPQDPVGTPCSKCNASSFPSAQGTTNWTNWSATLPANVTAQIINPRKVSGQCAPPQDCPNKKCEWWGTAQITNGSPGYLDNAQILLNGVAVSPGGQLNPGQNEPFTWTEEDPITANCSKEGEGDNAVIKFTVTNGAVTANSELTLMCPKCVQ